jgi:predicted MPP superfamily phosphohydrolase
MITHIKKHKRITIFFIMILFIIVFCIWQNNDIVVTKHEFVSEKVPKELDGFRIVHISDLHNKDFGSRLVKHMKKQEPDIIVITGDLIDSRNTRVDIALEFAKEATKIAPVYYVTGNHEGRSSEYPELLLGLTSCGVNILDNSSTSINYNNSYFNLIGLADPVFIEAKGYEQSTYEVIKETITKNINENTLNLLLAHRPELLRLYSETSVDLVFSGHAHGGQVRIPYIGGLVAPNQGFWPKYTSAIHSMDETSMVISRGLGNSIIPIRVFNRPEVVIVTLRSK